MPPAHGRARPLAQLCRPKPPQTPNSATHSATCRALRPPLLLQGSTPAGCTQPLHLRINRKGRKRRRTALGMQSLTRTHTAQARAGKAGKCFRSQSISNVYTQCGATDRRTTSFPMNGFEGSCRQAQHKGHHPSSSSTLPPRAAKGRVIQCPQLDGERVGSQKKKQQKGKKGLNMDVFTAVLQQEAAR